MSEHGEPGHVCRRVEIDATDSLGGLVIRTHPDNPEALVVDAWAHGISKRGAAHILRDIADGWESDAEAEEAEEGAMERARLAGLN